MNSEDLAGNIALVTGSSKGIGRGIALVLAERGCDFIVKHQDPDDQIAEAVAEEIRARGRRVLVVRADVSKEDEVTRLFEQVSATFGRLDILVNNAGTTLDHDIFMTSVDEWDFILETNLRSCFLCARHGMEIMKGQGSGRIVNISSIVAFRGALYGHVHYAASKGGIVSLTKTLAYTAAPLGITVNAVAPGLIETELLFKTHNGEDITRLAANVPLGLGTPRDVGLAVAFLCGEGGRYITGATIDVNGGAYMR